MALSARLLFIAALVLALFSPTKRDLGPALTLPHDMELHDVPRVH